MCFVLENKKMSIILSLSQLLQTFSLSFHTIIIFFKFIHFQPIVYFVTPKFSPNKHRDLRL